MTLLIELRVAKWGAVGRVPQASSALSFNRRTDVSKADCDMSETDVTNGEQFAIIKYFRF